MEFNEIEVKFVQTFKDESARKEIEDAINQLHDLGFVYSDASISNSQSYWISYHYPPLKVYINTNDELRLIPREKRFVAFTSHDAAEFMADDLDSLLRQLME